MLAAAAILAGLVVGLVRGGDPSRLVQHGTKGMEIFILVFLVQSVARILIVRTSAALGILLWCLACLFIAVAVRRLSQRNPPGAAGILGLGAALNAFVVSLNGAMPFVPMPGASAKAITSAVARTHGFYALADQRTQLAVLGDVLPVGGGLASIGDVLMAVGLAVFLAQIMSRPSVALEQECIK